MKTQWISPYDPSALYLGDVVRVITEPGGRWHDHHGVPGALAIVRDRSEHGGDYAIHIPERGDYAWFRSDELELVAQGPYASTLRHMAMPKAVPMPPDVRHAISAALAAGRASQ